MADKPATVKVKLTNTGAGPRSFFTAEGENRILRHGESWEGEILKADQKDLSSDLAQGDKAAAEALAAQGEGADVSDADRAAAAAAQAIQQAATELVKANTRPQLVTLAETEKVEIEGDDNKEQIALKIAQKRAAAS